MLSKLFSNIKLGLSLWLILFSLALWSLTFYLNCSECFSNFTASEWTEISGISILLIASLFLSSNIFNSFFHVTQKNYYVPLFLAIFISWAAIPLQWESTFSLFLMAVFYLNTYNILNGKDNNQVGFHLTAGVLSLILTWLTPIAIGFLALSFWQAIVDSHSGWRKYILPFYSFAFSFLILLGLAFVFDYQNEFIAKFKLWDQLSFDLERLKSNAIQASLAVFFFLLSQIEYLRALRKAPILKRKILSILNVQFTISFVLFVLFGSNLESLLIALFALSVLFANYLQYLKKFIRREFLIWISIGAGILSASVNLL